MHPSSEIRREYLVRLRGSPSDEVLERLRRGVELEDGPANCDAIQVDSTEASHTWIRVSLHEGRNREVRRLFEHEGFVVSRLTRIRYGSVELPRDLRTGAFKNLTATEISELAQLAGADEACRAMKIHALVDDFVALRPKMPLPDERDHENAFTIEATVMVAPPASTWDLTRVSLCGIPHTWSGSANLPGKAGAVLRSPTADRFSTGA
jgi:hypothetical protein